MANPEDQEEADLSLAAISDEKSKRENNHVVEIEVDDTELVNKD